MWDLYIRDDKGFIEVHEETEEKARDAIKALVNGNVWETTNSQGRKRLVFITPEKIVSIVATEDEDESEEAS